MSISLNKGEIYDDKFKIEEILGSGGNGTVYKAFQIDAARFVALKILHHETAKDEEYVARFLQEARALSKLSHPNIVTVYHLGSSDSHSIYLAMELIKGESIRAVLNSRNSLPVSESLLIIRDAARAMAYVHSCGIVHRDIKPENILLTNEPIHNTVKLVDFGLAKLSNQGEQKLTSTGQLVGTVKYMSPEQCRGQAVDFRTDIYSLTSCLYEMIVGKPAFDADTAIGIMYKQMNNEVPKIDSSGVDQFHPSLNEIIAKGLAKEPEQRFSSMDEMATQIDLTISLLNAATPSKEANNTKVRQVAFILVPLGLLLIGAFTIMQMKTKMKGSQQSLSRFSAEESSKEKQFERNYKRTLARIEKVYGSDEIALAQHLDDFAEELKLQRRFREAVPVYKRLLTIEEGSSKFTKAQVFRNMGQLAKCYRQEYDLEEAKLLLKRLQTIQEPTDSAALLYLSATLTVLGDCYRESELFNDAIPIYKKSLDYRAKAGESDDSDRAWTVMALALCFDNLGRYKEAAPLYQLAVQLRQKMLEETDVNLDFSIDRLALCYENLNRFKDAEVLYKKLLQLRKKAPHLDSSLIGKSQCELAECYLQQGLNRAAEPLFAEGWPKIESVDYSIINLLARICECYAKQGNFVASETWAKRMSESQQQLRASNPSQASGTNRIVQKTQQFLADCYRKKTK